MNRFHSAQGAVQVVGEKRDQQSYLDVKNKKFSRQYVPTAAIVA